MSELSLAISLFIGAEARGRLTMISFAAIFIYINVMMHVLMIRMPYAYHS